MGSSSQRLLTTSRTNRRMVSSSTRNGVKERRASGASRWGLLLVVIALAALFAIWWASRTASAPSSSTGYHTALEACSASFSTSTSAPTLPGYWQVVVEVDRPRASALVIIGGDTEVLCVTSRDETGRFTSTSSGWGRMTLQASPALSYETGEVLPGRDAASSVQALAGHVPAGTAAVVVLMSDGVTATAALATGNYLALVNTTAVPERIVALDSAGVEIASLANLHGLIPK